MICIFPPLSCSMSTSGGTTSSGGSTHIFRSLSSESQKREWSKRLSLRGMRHGGTAGGLAASKEVRQRNSSSSPKATPRSRSQLRLNYALLSLHFAGRFIHVAVEASKVLQSLRITETGRHHQQYEQHANLNGIACTWALFG